MYLAVRGKVFDVTPGKNFYGPGGPYENFAGRDASRGLACGSFDEDMLTKDLHGPLDDLSGLGPDEMQAMQDWEDKFTGTLLCSLASHKYNSRAHCSVLRQICLRSLVSTDIFPRSKVPFRIGCADYENFTREILGCRKACSCI